MKFSLMLSLVLLTTNAVSIAEPRNDGHIHYDRDVWERLPPQQAIAVLDDVGIQRAIVSSTPTIGTEKLHRLAPERIIAFLRPYRNVRDRYTWHSDPGIVDYVRQQLTQGIYRGFGEFHLFRDHKDTAVVRELMQLAKDRQLVLLAHADAETIETLMKRQPGLAVIWAHTGMDHPLGDVKRLFKQYPQLYGELSFRSDFTDDHGDLDPNWKRFFQQYSRRFVLGMDTYVPRRWASLSELSAEAGHWLSQLDAATAHLIARENIDRLFPE